MKKVQLTDGQPVCIERKSVKQNTLALSEIIKNECSKSGLSYVEVNKALYLADKELYENIIHHSCKTQS